MTERNYTFHLRMWQVVISAFAFLLPLLGPGAYARQDAIPAGRIVWWGEDNFRCGRNHTNGLVECSDEFVSNAVAVAAGLGVGLGLKSDAAVYAFGLQWPGVKELPANLSNVVSITAAGDSYWAIKGDGTVVRWGSPSGKSEDTANIVSELTNVTSIVCAGGNWYLAVKKDRTVLGFSLGDPERRLLQVKVNGEILDNVVGLAEMGTTPLVLKKNGMVYCLGYQTPGIPLPKPHYEARGGYIYGYFGGESAYLPYQYTTADPVIAGGEVLSNVVAIAGGVTHALALKADGTVVAWGENIYGEATVPAGLNHVIAIAAAEHQSLVLRRDGTVVSWGNNYFGQESVPPGLSNVVTIAAGDQFDLAVTTGNIPSSVFVQPHGRLEELEQKADLVFKGQVLSTTPITNKAFQVSSMTVNATTFKVISVLKGAPLTGTIVFEHYSGYAGMFAWDGPEPPAIHHLETGKSYLVFATRMDKPDRYYSPLPNATTKPDEYRQIADEPVAGVDGIMRTLDARPLPELSVKEAHWYELNLLLKDSNPTNVLFAIDKLDKMNFKGEAYEDWRRSDDFKRNRVLSALLPLAKNQNEQIAIRAISCFETPSNAAVVLKPFAETLIKVANKGQTPTQRLTAIRALSGIDGDVVSNSLTQLLQDKDESVRANAVQLLPRFPLQYAEPALLNAAKDSSPFVRSAAADAIGDGKMADLLPTLKTLFADPVGLINPVPPLTMDELRAGSHIFDDHRGDVHSSTGYALLKFDVSDVKDILETNLNDEGFHPAFLCKLATNDTGPWFTNLVEMLQIRREQIWKKVQTSSIKEKDAYFNAEMTLSGTYYNCWNLIDDYLSKLPESDFKNGRLDWCLDVLEDAGNTGSREPVLLYTLYREKGLNERATKFRQENGKCRGFDVIEYFNNADKEREASGSKS